VAAVQTPFASIVGARQDEQVGRRPGEQRAFPGHTRQAPGPHGNRDHQTSRGKGLAPMVSCVGRHLTYDQRTGFDHSLGDLAQDLGLTTELRPPSEAEPPPALAKEEREVPGPARRSLERPALLGNRQGVG